MSSVSSEKLVDKSSGCAFRGRSCGIDAVQWRRRLLPAGAVGVGKAGLVEMSAYKNDPPWFELADEMLILKKWASPNNFVATAFLKQIMVKGKKWPQ